MRKSVSLDSDRDRPIQIPNEFHERRFSRRFRGPRKSFTERRVARARRRRCYRPSRLRGSPPGFGRSWQRQREEREGEDGLALVGPRGRGGRERAFVRSPGDVSPKKKTSLSARDSRRAIRFFTTTCPPSRLAPRTRARSARDSRPIPADAARCPGRSPSLRRASRPSRAPPPRRLAGPGPRDPPHLSRDAGWRRAGAEASRRKVCTALSEHPEVSKRPL